ncbi:MAG: amino acid ABC transporter permease [Beutenbergiaceae bacterium]|uniref:amino acid ABC transporter permease n=1 Tax=Microbacterium sp. TaxID=51671 RepID=UPI003A88B233
MTSVLYDLPGPRAVLRNRLLGVLTVIVVGAAIAFLGYRLAVTGQFSAAKWQIFASPNVWLRVAEALGATLAAFVVAAIGSLILGVILAVGRLSDHRWVRLPVTAIVEVLRAVPVLVMMMLLFYGIPTAFGIKMASYWAVVIALIAYNGSVLAEAFRAGIEALPRGQKEAGYAIGLRKNGVMRLILFPQAVRAMLPVIISQLVVTMKDTALGFIITYPELLYTAKLLSSQQGRPILQSAFVIGGIYIVMCLILAGLAKWAEVRTRRSPRAIAAQEAVAPLLKDGTETEVIVTQRTRRGQDTEDYGD